MVIRLPQPTQMLASPNLALAEIRGSLNESLATIETTLLPSAAGPGFPAAPTALFGNLEAAFLPPGSPQLSQLLTGMGLPGVGVGGVGGAGVGGTNENGGEQAAPAVGVQGGEKVLYF